jgi:acetyl-CoA decarbonylase/synthase complex subunit gamma
MAMTGLDIYKLLPKTNCRDCGFATCLAFAMALAQKRSTIDRCPHVPAQAKDTLDNASRPPIRLVTIGTGDSKLEIGGELVMHRHEQKFYHAAIIGVLVEDTLIDAEIDVLLGKIRSLRFERVGQKMGVDLVCVRNSSHYRNKLVNTVRRAASVPGLHIAICADDASYVAEALKECAGTRPLLVCGEKARLEDFTGIAKANALPLAVTAATLEDAAIAAEKAKASGVDDIVLNISSRGVARRIMDFTYARRAALRKSFRPLGYPVMAFTEEVDSDLELAEAVSYVAKYASIVVVRNTDSGFMLPLLTARQDIYQDPQKPVQVEPKLYEIGKVTRQSPVLVTTNFSITYFTVAGEIEASKAGTYLICTDAEGMSVLTAWAAEKFTAERIREAMEKCGVSGMVDHRTITIPGYVSVLSGKLEDVTSWKVSVGPKEASGITSYLRAWKPKT